MHHSIQVSRVEEGLAGLTASGVHVGWTRQPWLLAQAFLPTKVPWLGFRSDSQPSGRWREEASS